MRFHKRFRFMIVLLFEHVLNQQTRACHGVLVFKHVIWIGKIFEISLYLETKINWNLNRISVRAWCPKCHEECTYYAGKKCFWRVVWICVLCVLWTSVSTNRSTFPKLIKIKFLKLWLKITILKSVIHKQFDKIM